MEKTNNLFLWTEAYRPKVIDDCILTPALKKNFKEILEKGELPNMILSGPAGTGKTTAAKALCNELGLDYILINGSEESGIDVLRNKIKQYASTVSIMSSHKVVILDEADYLNPQSTQPALRAFIEEFSNNCRFILTCNFRNRIIEPLQSRCPVYEFTLSKKQMPVLAGQFMKRLKFILDSEGIQYEDQVLAELIMKHMPDWRRVIGECQRYAISGKIDSCILVNLSDTNVKNLFTHLKDKNFKEMRQWVVDNIDTEAASIFRKIYDYMSDYAKPQCIPAIILILADYQYKAAFASDQELNVVACLTEIMSSGEWK